MRNWILAKTSLSFNVTLCLGVKQPLTTTTFSSLFSWTVTIRSSSPIIFNTLRYMYTYNWDSCFKITNIRVFTFRYSLLIIIFMDYKINHFRKNVRTGCFYKKLIHFSKNKIHNRNILGIFLTYAKYSKRHSLDYSKYILSFDDFYYIGIYV